ncbi:MAG TPA: hydroxymethylbilane synthase [Kineosporiaceae bacterium]|nr:hydroxymethylbilane synthase [Kineosporiaceae bacterium]
MTTTSATTPVPGTAATLRLGTRRSALATAQSGMVAAQIEAASVLAGRPVRVELVEVTTHGDVSGAPLSSFGGVGVFVSALRDALLEGRVDLAVHSLKDLPTAPCPGLTLAAVPLREDPRDALVSAEGLSLEELPAGARIGTGSPRRAAQLRAALPGVKIVDIRGNVDTRLRLVHDGELDAVVLAVSGLRRLGRDAEITQILQPTVMLPAPGQGALGIECRDGDAAVLAALAPLDHPATRAAVVAERALLATLEAGCAAPLGALAQVTTAPDATGELLGLQAVVADTDGVVVLRRAGTAPVGRAEELGRRLAGELLEDGAARLVAEASTGSDGPAHPAPELPVPDQPAAGDRGRISTPAGEGDL